MYREGNVELARKAYELAAREGLSAARGFVYPEETAHVVRYRDGRAVEARAFLDKGDAVASVGLFE